MALHQDLGHQPLSSNPQNHPEDDLNKLKLVPVEKLASQGPTWDYKPGGQAPYVSPTGGVVKRPTT